MSAQAKTQAKAAKFTFDTEFLDGGERVAPAAHARQRRTLTNEELEGLIAQARQDGENDASIRATQALERTLASVTVSLRSVLDQSRSEIEAVRAQAATAALAMARHIASAAIKALPAADVEMTLRQALHQAVAEPRITLRAHPAVIEALTPATAAIAGQEGYEGRLLLAADGTMQGADCRVEWRGGGTERSQKTIEDMLDALVARHFPHQPAPDTDVPNTETKG
jgi:flagellar assembly protein FliH